MRSKFENIAMIMLKDCLKCRQLYYDFCSFVLLAFEADIAAQGSRF
jgi:hypothetical protein